MNCYRRAHARPAALASPGAPHNGKRSCLTFFGTDEWPGAYATLAFIPPPRAARSLAAARSSSQMVSGLAMYTDE